MEAEFPGPELFEGLDGWEKQQQGNENIAFHSWLMRREMSGIFVRVSSLGMRLASSFLDSVLRKADRGPFYRQIFTLRKLDND
jgi:hypothetical protein